MLLREIKDHYQAAVIKTVRKWNHNRQTDQLKRTENAEIDPYL